MLQELLGNASQVSPNEAKKELEYLLPEEKVEVIFKVIRDLYIFTDKRLLLIDIQGVGQKKEFHSIPYKSISHYSVEAIGMVNPAADLLIYIIGDTTPIKKRIAAEQDLLAIHRLLAHFIL